MPLRVTGRFKRGREKCPSREIKREGLSRDEIFGKSRGSLVREVSVSASHFSVLAKHYEERSTTERCGARDKHRFAETVFVAGFASTLGFVVQVAASLAERSSSN